MGYEDISTNSKESQKIQQQHWVFHHLYIVKTKSAGKAWTEVMMVENFYTKMLFGLKQGDEMEHHLEKINFRII